MSGLNDSHNPSRKSWIDSANEKGADFPIQNLPYGVFSQSGGVKRIGVAIGSKILDLTALEEADVLKPVSGRKVFAGEDLNLFMSQSQAVWSATRAEIGNLLDANSPVLRDNGDLREKVIFDQSSVQMHLPIFVRSFTDFYASREHATNVGTMFRDPKNALMPNWLHIPIGYNGRASTVVVSGTDIHRPHGQLKGPNDAQPRFGPSAKLDIELELGAIVGTASRLGQPVNISDAYDMIFGYVLLNDWSARDIQVWEYQPLGPFQAKAFATSISPWIITREALEPFRTQAPEPEKELLDYLRETTPNNFDINLEVGMAPEGGDEVVISRTNYKYMYYSAAQQLTHHASSGCAMCTGDLLGSGTISGPTKDSLGSLLELTWNGAEPIQLGEQERTFIQDGDTLTLRGHCENSDYRIGFGECSGKIRPAVPLEG